MLPTRTWGEAQSHIYAGNDPQLLAVKHNVDIGARVPAVDVAKLSPLQLPHDYMPMLSPLPATDPELVPYVDAVFGELSEAETARLIAK